MRRPRVVTLVLAVAGLVGCGHSKTGPTPTVSDVQPKLMCNAQADVDLTITGASFSPLPSNVLGGAALLMPVASVDGPGPFTACSGSTATTCDLSTETGYSITPTTEITARIPAGTLPTPASGEENVYAVVVTNPTGHQGRLEAAFTNLPPPTITSISPDHMCIGRGTREVTIHGTDFHDVAADGTTATKPTVEFVAADGTSTPIPDDQVTYVDDQTLEVSIDDGELSEGTYTVRVTNPEAGSCYAELKDAFTVTVCAPCTIAVFDVDPDVVYSGVNTPVTVRGKDFTDGTTVTLIDADGNDVTTLTPSSISSDGKKLEVTIPSGLPAGTYSIRVDTADGCPATLDDALTVVDQLTVRVCSVAPPFGWTGEDTAVAIHGGSCTGTADFAATPRAWVVLADTLVPVRNVSFVSASELHGVVPKGIATGTYPLLVQNPPPSNAVGLLPDAFTVVADPVPIIDNVTPANGYQDETVTITGHNFRAPVEVTLVAADLTTTYPLTNVTVDSDTQITATVPITTAPIPLGTYLVHLVDSDEGTYGPDWSSFIITGPSAKLAAFVATTALPAAREAHGMLPGAVTNQSRYLYVIGGDQGPSAPYDDVLANQLDSFGSLDTTWSQLRNRLPAPRTGIAAAQAGHFLYVAGGRDASGAPQADVLRAEILLPADAPKNVDPSLDFVEQGQGLDAGTWYYRVAAVMATTDATNADGEGLPSDEAVIRAPAVSTSTGPLKWRVTLTWDAVPRAGHYRIYRNPTANGTSGEEVLLADNVTGTDFTDDGSLTPDASTTPMPQGSTGLWLVAGTLQTARSDARAAVAHDANNGTAYLYVVGGQTAWPAASGNLLDTYEYAPLAADGGTFTAGFTRDDTHLLPAKTAQASLVVADNANASVIPAATASYLYLTCGVTTTGGTSDNYQAQVGGGGAAGVLAWAAANAKPGQSRQAPAGIFIFNHYYIFGGFAPSGALSSANLAELVGAGDFQSFSSVAAAMSTPHALGAATFTTGHAYISGGFSGATFGASPTAVVEWAQFTL